MKPNTKFPRSRHQFGGNRPYSILAVLGVGAAVACGGGENIQPNPNPVNIDADGNGVADDLMGTPLDTNLDGVFDSIDTDGDMVSDGALLDTNADGIFDAIDSDGDGNGDITSNLGSGGATNTVGSGGGTQVVGSGGGTQIGSGGGTQIGSGGGTQIGSGGGGGGAVTPGQFGETGTMAACTITVNADLAPEMPTVGVVDFSVTGLSTPVNGAVIQFGLDTNYGLTAPVDTASPGYKTLMLGMRSETAYHYRVGVSTGTEYCYSPDMTIQTGKHRTGINAIQKQVTGTVAKGFFIAAAKSTAIIFDQDGEVVWGYTFSAGGTGPIAGIFSARISYDGKYMIARDLGQFDAGNQGKFFSVALDGSDYKDFDVLGGDHHDFTVTPTGIAYIAKEAQGGYDKIYTAGVDGSNAKPLVDLKPIVDAYPQSAGGGGMGEKSHFNAIHYWADRDIYTLSNRESDMIAVVSGSGEFLEVIGKAATGSPSFMTILAEGASGGSGDQVWRVQHGHDLYAENKLLVFSNGNFGNSTSHALHYTINGNTATLDWQYTAMGNSSTQGDIQMLPNGNVAITASNAGTIHQINSSQQLQASYSNGANGFGYVTFRSSLYGEPIEGR